MVTEFTDNNNSNVFYVETAHVSEALALAWPVSSAHANGQSEAASQPATHKYRMPLPLPLPQFTGAATSRLLSI